MTNGQKSIMSVSNHLKILTIIKISDEKKILHNP